MEKVCVNCGNKNAVNSTDNRLVTESCGHVKCIQCLVQEKSGCLACKRVQEDQGVQEDERVLGEERVLVDQEVLADQNLEDSLPVNEVVEAEHATVQTEMPMLLKEVTKGNQESDIKDFSKKAKLDVSHIVFENGIYKCLKCERKFMARSQKTYHAYCNGQPKPYQCPYPECVNKSFATNSHFKYHLRVHRGERAFSCDVCGATFVLMSKLKRHKLKHTKEKQHECSVCRKAFNNMSAIRKHMRTHTGEKPYRCAHCHAGFRDSSNYNKHVPICPERKERRPLKRPHRCLLCAQTFLSEKDLRRHRHVHKAPEFVCEVCSPRRLFRRKDNLDRHNRNTHPELAPRTTVLPQQNGTTSPEPPKKVSDEPCDKAQLKVLNPLPPLSEEVIQKHLFNKPEPVIDKSYIIEANIARKSVIVGKCLERKVPSPVTEYVHKIRKANSMSQKEVPLPPIDENKFLQLLGTQNRKNTLDVGPLPKNIQTYEKILREKADQHEDEKVTEVHWRKKRLTENE